MKIIYPLFLAALLFLLLPSCSSSPEVPSDLELSTYCVSFSSFEEIDALADPSFKEHIGNSHFRVSTTHEEAQKWFNQGLNLLHGFWHAEAYRAFKTALTFDPQMAMGWWGIAMCRPGFADAERALWASSISKAVALMTNSSPQEQQLILATLVLVEQGLDAAGPAFQRLWDAYPEEVEIVALASLIVRYSTKDLLGAEGKQVRERMELALRKFPEHVGLQHYYVHLLESTSDFALAIPYAERIAAKAYQLPHLLHMPGHLYFLTGDYDRAAEVFYDAVKADEQWHTQEGIPAAADANYMHDLHYLAVVEAERNNYQQALLFAQKYASLALRNTYWDAAAMSSLYEGRMLPALVHIRFQKWPEAQQAITEQLKEITPIPNTDLAKIYLQFMLRYCEGMEAIEQNDLSLANQKGATANQMLQTYSQMGSQVPGAIDAKNINKALTIMSMSIYELAGWIDNRDAQEDFMPYAWNDAFELESLIPYDEPPRLIYPIGESLGRLHLLRGEPQAAELAFDKALLKRPNSPFILALKEKR